MLFKDSCSAILATPSGILAMDRIWRTATLLLFFIAAIPFACSYRYDITYADYNLNENQYAVDPLDYWYVFPDQLRKLIST